MRQFFFHDAHSRREFFKEHLYAFIKQFSIDLIIPQNLLSFPQNIPLSMALAELIAETNIPTIAHHHDFTWERKALLVNSIWDYINMAVPPTLRAIQHVVINSSASHQLARRSGVSSTIIPNVMNFEEPPPEPDDYSSDLRNALGIAPDELLILQPTRVVQRKGIEHAIELVGRLGRRKGDGGFGRGLWALGPPFGSGCWWAVPVCHSATVLVCPLVKEGRQKPLRGLPRNCALPAKHASSRCTGVCSSASNR